jgi:hypothetical protein
MQTHQTDADTQSCFWVYTSHWNSALGGSWKRDEAHKAVLTVMLRLEEATMSPGEVTAAVYSQVLSVSLQLQVLELRCWNQEEQFRLIPPVFSYGWR